MGKETTISWAQSSWNCWHGCIKVSPGCQHCYMYRDKARYGQDPRRVQRSRTTFTAPLRWQEPRTIFTCSWSDFFIAEADGWRDEAWEVIRQTPQHLYLILTKRPERIVAHLPTDWPLPHVWLGVSVESADYLSRITVLQDVQPVAHRFISCEPLLSDLGVLDLRGIDWVIIGGESGPAARDMRLAWLASIVAQCQSAGILVHVKQDAGATPGRQGRIPDDLWALKAVPSMSHAQEAHESRRAE
jgi:protein gp37